MAGAPQVFKDNKIKADELVEAQRKEEEAKDRRRVVMEEAIAELEGKVASIIGAVGDAATNIVGTAENMDGKIDTSSSRSLDVAEASERTTTNVETVASAADELSASISEISRQVGESSSIVSSAVSEAERANQMVQGLSEAADKIGEVVNLITNIADQTNLLALNATIEAARAGDAGKGFAVVASVVNNLANQTAKATEEIGGQIGGIQNATRDAVTAIQGIATTIGKIDEIASTSEIARNVEQAATGTQEVTSNISGVNQAANDILGVSGDLSKQADLLKSEVDQFLNEIRTA